jgi:4-hydroxy-tetrahydrodipicolinate reductase
MHVGYRVIQWATGMLGTEAAIGIIGRPDLELVGAWVHTADKDGRDVGELCGLGPLGVRATTDKDALLALPADCVSYMRNRAWGDNPRAVLDEMLGILRAGKNVVSSTWPMLVYPKGVSDEVDDLLDAACRDGGTSFYTGGIDPGYGSAGLALSALNIAREVSSVHTYEIQNQAHWAHADFGRYYGFGGTDRSSIPILQPGATTRYHESTIRLLADAIGVEIEELVETNRVTYAEESFEFSMGSVAAGTICGIAYQVQGRIGGEAVVTVEHVIKIRDQDFPELAFAGDGYRVEICGEPDLRLDMAFSSATGNPLHAVHAACAMALVNAIPQVCEADPGVLTLMDLTPYPSTNVVLSSS